MIFDNNVWHSPVRQVTATVELYEGSTLASTFTEQDRIKSFDIQRVGSSNQFFGFGVCQRLNVHFVDADRSLDCSTANGMKVYLCAAGERLNAFPRFKVSEVHRDENTNEASVTAYDKLYNAAEHTFNELELSVSYSIHDVAVAICSLLEMNNVIVDIPIANYHPFATQYPNGANFEGTETLREVLDDIAEATQTVYYLDGNDNLVFKMPNRDGEPVYTITKADYITLSSKTNRRLSDLGSATDLEDNVVTESGIIGTTQYAFNNGFWTLRDDIGDLLNNAIEAVKGLTINQFDCVWRGKPSLEIGDKIGIVTKDNETVYSYVYDDTITYNGALSQRTAWQYSETTVDNANSTSIGDALKKTFARVDKANQQIELVAGEMASFQMTADTIQQSVINMDSELDMVLSEVSTMMTADELTIAIEQALEGVESVTTKTGYKFDANGLEVSRNDSSIKTVITEDGMTIYRSGNEILVADNLGVKAEDLHADTFLIIGNNSRLENYKDSRTACYYVRMD